MTRWPRDLPAAAAYLLLAAAAAVHSYGLAPYLRASLHEFDAVHMYLPGARELLAQGLAFFLQERSLYAPPLAFVYPALLGATLAQVKLANALLSGVTLLLAFRCGALLHSRSAGVAAAWLFAANPLMRPYLAAPITEGPFLFWCAVWLWGLGEWVARGRRWGLAASAIGVCCAALTRAPLFYWIVVLVVATAWAAWRLRPELRRVALPLLVAYAAALAPPAAVSVKNYLVFGFPFFATGGGNALYLGHNPLTRGYDPNYLGLIYDVGAIARDQPHLTLEAERLLRGAARLAIAESSAGELLGLHARKAAAFVFVTNAEDDVVVQRAWRIALLLLAAAGLAAARSRPLRWALGGMLAFQLAIHVPVLYTHRYSVGALDLWLVIAAGAGAAALLAASWKRIAAAALAITAAAGIGALAYERGGRPMPDVFGVARLLVWHAATPGAAAPHRGLEVPVRDAPWFRDFNNHVLVLEVANARASGRPCERVTVAFRPHGDPDWHAAPPLRVPADGRVRRYQLGGVPLQLHAEGTLRVAPACEWGGVISVQRMAVYAALGAIDYHERLLGKPPMFPLER